MIYMDQAAGSIWHPEGVKEAVSDAMEHAGNPGRGAYGPALEAGRILSRARKAMALLLNAESPSRIAFTSGATAALNIALLGLFKEGDHVITTRAEHNSVLRPLYMMQRRGVELSFLDLDEKGNILTDGLADLIRENTKAVVIGGASNVTGDAADLDFVSKVCTSHHILLVVDAAQSLGWIPVDVRRQHIDVLCFAGHKGLFGPSGTGGIYVREGLSIPPLMAGGTGSRSFDMTMPFDMPSALEPGSSNICGIAGLLAALSWRQKEGTEKIHHDVMALEKNFILRVCDIPGIRLYGDYDGPDERRVPILSLNLGDCDSATVSDLLWTEGEVCTRAGAHCAPLLHEALGTKRQGMVRFSFSPGNTGEEVDRAAGLLRAVAGQLS